MATTAIFDNATLADAVNKAGRIAPTKGAGFDKAAGIQFQVWPQERICRVRATNLEVSFEMDIDILEGKGDPRTWRMPSGLLTSLMSTLPIGDGAATEFIDRGSDAAIRLKCGRTVVKMNMYEGDLGEGMFAWEPTGGFTVAHDLAQRVEQVSWATDSKSNILQGVHVNGEHLIATDGKVMAMTPAKIETPTPITVPLSTLSALLTGASDCRLGTSAKRCLLQLDEHTRATSVLVEGNYPDIRRAMRTDFLGTMKVHRGQFSDTLDRLMVLARTEKLPRLSLELDGTGLVSMLTLDLDIPDIGRMQDSIDVETDFDSIFNISFTPNDIVRALSHCKSDYVHIDFGHADEKKSPLSNIQLRDEKDYISYIAPRKDK